MYCIFLVHGLTVTELNRFVHTLFYGTFLHGDYYLHLAVRSLTIFGTTSLQRFVQPCDVPSNVNANTTHTAAASQYLFISLHFGLYFHSSRLW